MAMYTQHGLAAEILSFRLSVTSVLCEKTNAVH